MGRAPWPEGGPPSRAERVCTRAARPGCRARLRSTWTRRGAPFGSGSRRSRCSARWPAASPACCAPSPTTTATRCIASACETCAAVSARRPVQPYPAPCLRGVASLTTPAELVCSSLARCRSALPPCMRPSWSLPPCRPGVLPRRQQVHAGGQLPGHCQHHAGGGHLAGRPPARDAAHPGGGCQVSNRLDRGTACNTAACAACQRPMVGNLRCRACGGQRRFQTRARSASVCESALCVCPALAACIHGLHLQRPWRQSCLDMCQY